MSEPRVSRRRRFEVWAPHLYGWTRIDFYFDRGLAQALAAKIPGSRVVVK